MATIIDALMVTLGLDSSGFHKGVDQSREDLKKVSQETQQAAIRIEAATLKLTNGISRVRQEILGLYALITAGRGIRQLMGDVLSGDAALGRFSNTIGMNVQQLNAWQGVVQRFGGTAGEFASTARNLRMELERVRITGQSSIIEPFWKLGVNLADHQGKARGVQDILLDTADSIQRNHMTQPQVGAWFNGILDDGTIAALMKGRAAVQAYLEEQKKLGVVTERSAQQAQEMQRKLLDLRQGFESLVRTVVTNVSPAIIRVMDRLSKWVLDHRTAISEWMDTNLTRLMNWVEGFDWGKFGDNIASAFERASAAVERIITKIEGLSSTPVGKWIGQVINPTANKPAGPAEAGGVPIGAPGTVKDGKVSFDYNNSPVHNAVVPLANALATLGLIPKPGEYNKESATVRVLQDQMAAVKENTEALKETLRRRELEQLFMGAKDKTDIERGAERMLGGGGGNDLYRTNAPGPRVVASQAAAEAYKFWISKGFTPAGAAAMVSREQLESQGNPTAVGDHGQAYGLFQMHPDRVKAIQEKTGINIYGASANTQREAFYREGRDKIDPQWGAVFDEVKNGRDAYTAGATVSLKAIRPGLTAGAKAYEADATGKGAEQYQRTYGTTVAPDMPNQPYYPGALRVDRSTTSTQSVSIGQVTVNTQATDADAIAKGMNGALTRNLLGVQSNSGLR